MSDLSVNAPVKEKKPLFKNQVLQRLVENKLAMGAFAILVILAILSIIAPWICKYTYYDMDLMMLNAPPSLEHPFGTDALGRDQLSRILYGGRYSLTLGFASSMATFVIAEVIGSVAGYFGGWVDNVIMRICDVIQAIPSMLLSIIISVTLGVGFFNTIVALAIGGIPSSVRLVRSSILSIRKEEFIEAAQTVNASSGRIMFLHILPNTVSPMIVGTTMGMGNCIKLAASLAFIGLGVQPPTPEWGALLSAGKSVIRNYPHLITFPGLFIFLAVLAFNIFGDGIRDAMDPKLKK